LIISSIVFLLMFGLNMAEAVRDGDAMDTLFFITEIFDTLIIVTAIFFAATVAIEARELRHSTKGLADDLQRARNKSAKWQSAAETYSRGIGQAINEQMAAWGLSNAECEVATLILKGLSHKEIAEIRASSEATVRQQAAAIYTKSGLRGRNELAAYFLEDLTAPLGKAENFEQNGISFASHEPQAKH
jgi:DNA-binding CsgD family transcriptional regulator